MNWLARLKELGTDAKTEATEPTKPAPQTDTVPKSAGFVGFVAPIPAGIEKTEVPALTGHEPGKALTIQQNSEIYCECDAVAATPDPDRWCWPHSSAMNTAEIDTFTARLARFTDKGMNLDDAEKLADSLVTWDREGDDRRLCLECVHLAGHSLGAMRCGNWQRAGLGGTHSGTQLSAGLVVLLQRCNGFARSIIVRSPKQEHHLEAVE